MRVAVVAGTDAGHAFPAAGLAAALRRRGHQTLSVAGARWLPAMARAGLPAIALPDIQLRNAHPDGAVGLFTWAPLAARPLADELRAFGPDLVVADVLALYGALAAGLLDVPWAQLIPHPLQDLSPLMPPPGSRLGPSRGPLGRARDRALYRIAAPARQKGRAQVAAARASIGLPPHGPAAARLVAAVPALEWERADWPATAHQVGPIEWDPAEGELELPPGDGPLVFLSASTVRGGADDLLGAAVAGLAGAGVRVACTQFAPYAGVLPPWAVAGPGRQGPVIDACSVMVSGAGHGILAKALTRGRPVVAVPGGGEQGENAARLRRAGLGVEIAPRRLTPRRLAEAVLRVVSHPSYGAAAARCVPAPGSPPPGDVAVDVLERVLAPTPA